MIFELLCSKNSLDCILILDFEIIKPFIIGASIEIIKV